jgi:hypothetical protein
LGAEHFTDTGEGFTSPGWSPGWLLIRVNFGWLGSLGKPERDGREKTWERPEGAG